MQLGRDLISLYKLLCADIAISAQRFNIKLHKTLEESKNIDTEIVISDAPSNVSEALQGCISMNARLPEIQDITSHEQICQAAIAANITKTRAGIYWDQLSSNYCFLSDHATIQSLTPNPWKKCTTEDTILGKNMVKILDPSSASMTKIWDPTGTLSTATHKTNSKSNWQLHLRLVHGKESSVKDPGKRLPKSSI
jgi:hypothetical protein